MGAGIMGFPPDCHEFEALGGEVPNHCHVDALRAIPALFGSASVPTAYVIQRLLGTSSVASFLGTMFLAFDGLHVIISRIALADSIMLWFSQAALLVALLVFRRVSFRPRGDRLVRLGDRALLFLSGWFCGLALAIKWQGSATPILIFGIAIFGIPPFLPDEPMTFIDVGCLASGTTLAYIASFLLFFGQCHRTGGQADLFMSVGFQKTLIGNSHQTQGDNNTSSLNSWQKFIEYNYKMVQYNRNVRGNTTVQPGWYEWPLNLRGSVFHARQHSDQTISRIYAVMNPIMAIIVFFLMIVFFTLLVVLIRYRENLRPGVQGLIPKVTIGSVLGSTWLVSLLPTVVLFRAGPLFQYLPALLFAQMIAAVFVDTIQGDRAKRALVLVFSLMTIIAYVYWCPWVYSIPLPEQAHQRRVLLPKWRL
uniref:Uncharacterized protein n=1 Tax=Compsopogon caeruleus TaxID=31354 RepID=A0A6T6C6G7_9RHOD